MYLMWDDLLHYIYHPGFFFSKACRTQTVQSENLKPDHSAIKNNYLFKVLHYLIFFLQCTLITVRNLGRDISLHGR